MLFIILITNEYADVFVKPFLQSQQKRLYMVKSGNFRLSNDINSPIITVLDSGTIVVEIEKDNVKKWFHGELENGTRGWIYHTLLMPYADDFQTKDESAAAIKIDEEPEEKSVEPIEETNNVEMQENVSSQSVNESAASVKTDEEPEKKSAEPIEETNKERLRENVSLQLDRKSMYETVPQITNNPVNKYLLFLAAVLLLTNVTLVLLYKKSRKKSENIIVNKKNVKELENYKRKNEKNNEKVSFLGEKISRLEKEIEEKSLQIDASEKSKIGITNSKNEKELENYKRKNEKINEKVMFLEKKISQLEKEIEE